MAEAVSRDDAGAALDAEARRLPCLCLCLFLCLYPGRRPLAYLLYRRLPPQDRVLVLINIVGPAVNIEIKLKCLIGSHAVSAGQAHPRAAVVYRVQAGDTLWTIASRLEPSKDPREVIDLLMRTNHLGTPTIVPGQTLRFVAP